MALLTFWTSPEIRALKVELKALKTAATPALARRRSRGDISLDEQMVELHRIAARRAALRSAIRRLRTGR